MNADEYARSRGFDPDEFRRVGIRSEGPHLVIPIRGRAGDWYYRIHRPNGQPKYESPPGVVPHLYNPLGLGPHSSGVWICEGEFDTLSLVCAGIAAVGVLGTKTFHRSWHHLFNGAEIVIATDSDQAGEDFAEVLAELWPGRTSRFRVIEPYTDLNDWFRHDRDGFTRAVIDW